MVTTRQQAMPNVGFGLRLHEVRGFRFQKYIVYPLEKTSVDPSAHTFEGYVFPIRKTGNAQRRKIAMDYVSGTKCSDAIVRSPYPLHITGLNGYFTRYLCTAFLLIYVDDAPHLSLRG